MNTFYLSLKALKRVYGVEKGFELRMRAKKVEQNEIQYAILILHFQGFYGFYAVFIILPPQIGI